MDLLLHAWADASPLVGLVLLAVGIAYLFFGKWLFRVMVAGLAIAVGLELGRLLDGVLDAEAPWLPLLVGAALGGLSWPLWQVVVFLGAGGALALVLGEIVHGVDTHQALYIVTAGFGFIAGGLVAIAAMRPAAVVLTALIGSMLILAGVLAVGHGTLPFVESLAESGMTRVVIVMALAGAGIGVQVLLPSAEEARERREGKAAGRAKSDDDAEARRRYERYLTRSG